MRKLIPLAYVSAVLIFSSCATYRNGQTPDDVYMAADPEVVSYVNFNRNEDFRDERFVPVQQGNRVFNHWNNFYCDDPTRLMVLNNRCYCLTNGGMMPFVPAREIKNMPTMQNNPSVISSESSPRRINYGKYSVPAYENGSSAFPRANNRNDIQYPSSDKNGGSRYFQSNSSSNSSGSSSGSGTRSGRRN
jgi:hypothetical protein